jgi:hypothetical protein
MVDEGWMMDDYGGQMDDYREQIRDGRWRIGRQMDDERWTMG